jgi:hypothetical protein
MDMLPRFNIGEAEADLNAVFDDWRTLRNATNRELVTEGDSGLDGLAIRQPGLLRAIVDQRGDIVIRMKQKKGSARLGHGRLDANEWRPAGMPAAG